jgi:hypothetical protein
LFEFEDSFGGLADCRAGEQPMTDVLLRRLGPHLGNLLNQGDQFGHTAFGHGIRVFGSPCASYPPAGAGQRQENDRGNSTKSLDHGELLDLIAIGKCKAVGWLLAMKIP